MFDLKANIVKNIINGVKKGIWAKEYGNIMATNYLAQGFLLTEDVATISVALDEWEESQKVPEEVPQEEVTEPTEEVIEEVIENLEATE